jgi:hypothetical protein
MKRLLIEFQIHTEYKDFPAESGFYLIWYISDQDYFVTETYWDGFHFKDPYDDSIFDMDFTGWSFKSNRLL